MLIYRLILKSRGKRWRSAPAALVPTICVGNVTVGGTGKTPHTELILSLLQNSPRWGNSNLAMLSRGYKRSSKGFQKVQVDSTAAFAGDEPLQIKKKYPAVAVAVDKNRVKGCARLVSDGADLIVLDDAFQYNKLHASLNIVLVDFSRPVFDDSLLPFGRLRDIPSRIFEADMIIVTKCPRNMEEADKAEFAKNLHLTSYNAALCSAETPKGKSLTLLFSYIDYCEPVPVYPETDARYSYSKKVALFSGIANDTPLRAYLSDTYKISEAISFPDHHRFGKGDIRKIRGLVRHYPTAALATTEKDAQRLLDNPNVPSEVKQRLFMIPIKVTFVSDEELSTLVRTLDSI